LNISARTSKGLKNGVIERPRPVQNGTFGIRIRKSEH
jgi:hypothetical protein